MLFDGQRPVAELSPPVLGADQARWLDKSE
jgi:hypothetical protein